MLIKWNKQLLAVDKEENCFKIFDLKGNLIKTIKNENFNHPTSLTLFNNQIIVANSFGNNLLIFDNKLNYISSFSKGFAEPIDTFSYKNKLFVCNRDIHNINIFNKDLDLTKTYPEENKFDLYNNIPLYMPCSISIENEIIYICQINNLTAINTKGYFLFQIKNNKVFEYIKSNGKNLFVLNSLENKIDIYGLSGTFIKSINLEKDELFQCFEIIGNKLIVFTVFFEKFYNYKIEEVESEDKLILNNAENPLQLIKLAEIYQKNNEFNKMLESYEKILKNLPGYPPVMDKLNQLIEEVKK